MASGPKDREALKAGVVPDDPEQFHIFVEAARDLGIEEIGEPYERAVNLILSRRKADQPADLSEIRPKRSRKKRSAG